MLLRKNEPRIFDSAEMRGFSYMCEITFIIYEFRRINQKTKRTETASVDSQQGVALRKRFL